MKNLNWGHGILIFYLLFVSVLVMALVASMKVDHSLVQKDYYALDLAYQERYDALERGQSEGKLNIEYQQEASQLILQFTSDQLEGDVLFYRPSDPSLDFKRTIEQPEVIFDTESMRPGLWKMKVNWFAEGLQYYKEEKIYI